MEDQPIWILAKKRPENRAQRDRAGLATRVAEKLGEAIGRERLVRIVEEESPGDRDRIYPPLVTLELFVEQVISVDQACQDAVGRALSQRTSLGQSACSLNTGPYYKARQRLGVEALRRIAREVAHRSERGVALPWCFRGRSVKLLDGTTVSMPDTPANQRAFPQNSEQKPGLGFPIARIVGLISLATGCVTRWRECACEGTGNGELPQFVGLLDSLAGGDLVVADRAYFSYCLLALLQQRGVDAEVSPQIIARYEVVAGDGLAGAGAADRDRATDR